MALYNMILEGDVLKVSFGDASTNDKIVVFVKSLCEQIKADGGMGLDLKVNGPASLPVAMTIAHQFAHVSRSVSAFDPKLGKYVVCITHNPDLKVGDLID